MAQVVLSVCYFMYNSIWTRLHSELEWNDFALDYKPLRVSTPKGGQASTYRLQLPYLYGIPLIVGSIFLHWLASNAIYIVLIEGGTGFCPLFTLYQKPDRLNRLSKR